MFELVRKPVLVNLLGSKNEVAESLKRMNTGDWPDFAAALSLASRGEFIAGRSALTALVGLPAGAEEYPG